MKIQLHLLASALLIVSLISVAQQERLTIKNLTKYPITYTMIDAIDAVQYLRIKPQSSAFCHYTPVRGYMHNKEVHARIVIEANITDESGQFLESIYGDLQCTLDNNVQEATIFSMPEYVSRPGYITKVNNIFYLLAPTITIKNNIFTIAWDY